MKKLFLLLIIPIQVIGQIIVPDQMGLQEAIDNVTPGDTVYITAKGSPYDPVEVTKKKSSRVVLYMMDDAMIQGSPEHSKTSKGIITVLGGENYQFLNWHVFGNNPYRDQRLGSYSGVEHGYDLVFGKNIEILYNLIENTTASGIYKAASCENVTIDHNEFWHNGFFQTKNNRLAHRGVYAQNWNEHPLIVTNNVFYHGLHYDIHVWHQSGSEKSKLRNVKIDNNIVVSWDETAIHWGGNNQAGNGTINDNSVYTHGQGYGIRLGYKTLAASNMNDSVHIERNIIQGGDLRIINPRNHRTPDEIHVNDNLIDRGIEVDSWNTNDISKIISKWNSNLIPESSSVVFWWVGFSEGNQPVVQDFNRRMGVGGGVTDFDAIKLIKFGTS